MVVCLVCRFLGLPGRGGSVSIGNGGGRISFFSGAGCGEAVRARGGVGLSCLPRKRALPPLPCCKRGGTLFGVNWVWTVFIICSFHRRKRAIRKNRRGVRVWYEFCLLL